MGQMTENTTGSQHQLQSRLSAYAAISIWTSWLLQESIGVNSPYQKKTVSQQSHSHLPSWSSSPGRPCQASYPSAQRTATWCWFDSKIGHQFVCSRKVLYLFGDRYLIKSWLKSKELQQAQNCKGKIKNNPISGAKMTEHTLQSKYMLDTKII